MTLRQIVNKADTTTALTSFVNPSAFGQPVTFTATVSVSAPGAGAPGGKVQFFDDATSLGQATLSGNIATLTASTLAVGAHSVSARYKGNVNANASTSPAIAQDVTPPPTETTLNVSVNPSVFGQNVTFKATVSAVAPGGGTPAGNIEFYDGGVLIGASALNRGRASFATTTLSVGTHDITAHYVGSADHLASTSPTLSQTTNRASTKTNLSGPNNSTVGQTVTFTATVNPVGQGTGVPDGTVQFRINGVDAPDGLVTLVNGVATYTTNSLPTGTSTITAVYGGSANYNPSSGSLVHRRR